MKNFYLFAILFFACHFPVFLQGQKMSTAQLVKAWKVSDTSQSRVAEVTYADMKQNAHKDSFYIRLRELQQYLERNNDRRVEVRLHLYRVWGKRSLNIPVEEFDVNGLNRGVFLAGLLKDNQLQSELYGMLGFYSENLESKLFYCLKSIGIQQDIGEQYFPAIYKSYFQASNYLYLLDNFRQSIDMGWNTLSVIKTPEEDPVRYIFQLDLLGAAFKEFELADSVVFCYSKILSLLKDKNLLSDRGMDSIFRRIWTGIAKGGIAQGFFLQKRFDEAIPLLRENISSSSSEGLWSDASLALNTLAKIEFLKGESEHAISSWKQAKQWAHDGGDIRQELKAAKGIMDIYHTLEKYDSAFYYSNVYYKLSDSLHSITQASKLSEIRTRVQNDEMESQLRKSERHIAWIKTLRNLILISLSGIIIGILLWQRKRNTKHKGHLTQLQTEKEIVEGKVVEAHQNIFNIQQMLVVVQQDADKKKDLIDKLQNEKIYSDLNETNISLRNHIILTDDDWHAFKDGFDKSYPFFWERLKEFVPSPTSGEQRFMALAKLGMNNKEIAAATGVSPDSIRVMIHRMKKKHELLDGDPRMIALSL